MHGDTLITRIICKSFLYYNQSAREETDELQLIDRHPVHNDYLPIQFREETFLKDAGDTSDKVWNEDALVVWESEENGGKEWEGRLTRSLGSSRSSDRI